MSFLEDAGIEVGEEIESMREMKIGDYVMPPSSDIHFLNELIYGDGECYFGKPLIGDVETRTYENDDGSSVSRSRITLYIVDDYDECYAMPINLKEEGDIQHNVHTRSKLFPLIKGVGQTLYPDDPLLDEHYELKTCNLASIRKMVNEDIPRMGLKIRTMDGGDNIGDYNSFVIVSPELENE